MDGQAPYERLKQRTQTRPKPLNVSCTHVVPIEGADLLGGVSRRRRRLLSIPAVTAVEITPVERAS